SGQPGVIHLLLKDGAGKPLSGMSISGLLYRNAHAGIDQPLTAAQTRDGGYEVRITPPEPGLWELRLQVTGTAEPMSFSHRLEVTLNSTGVLNNDVR
ncbi:MAG: FixH family protein, partial [Magnetococcales bacterium]|nr:FixH family protein [Magnetococcales bacterium]